MTGSSSNLARSLRGWFAKRNDAAATARGLASRLEPLLVLALAWSVFMVNIGDQSMQSDEIAHLLAARSWLSDGTLYIAADWEYSRAFGFTIALATAFSLFGESEVVARLLSVFFVGLWVAALFLWLRWAVGRTAAWWAAALFCLAPQTLVLSHFVRFYAPHGLAFFLGAIGIYFLLAGRHSRPAAAAAAVATVIALALALHLQKTTVIGFIALASWIAVASQAAWRVRLAQALRPRWRLWALVAALALAAAALVQSGAALHWLTLFRTVLPGFAANKDNVLFYHYLFVENLPALWALLPLAALLAIARRPSPAIFCAILFGVAVILHSFAAQKLERYLHYVVPFFFALWGIALAEAMPWVRSLAARAMANLSDTATWARLRMPAAWVATGLVLVFFVGGNPGYKTSYKMLRDWPHMEGDPDSSWRQARSFLQPWLNKASVVLTTNPVPAIYYFGRSDIAVGKAAVQGRGGSEIGETGQGQIDAISTVESLRVILSCYPSGLFVGNSFRWRNSIWGIADETADYLMTRAERIAVPDGWDLIAFWWERPDDVGPPECSSLPRFPAAG